MPTWLHENWTHRHNAVTSSHDRIRVVVVASSICAAAHGDNPFRLWHLIIDLTEGWCHLVCQRPRNDHDVRLARGRSEDDPESIKVISAGPTLTTSAKLFREQLLINSIFPPRGSRMHHLDSTTSEAEGHGPDGSRASPVNHRVHLGNNELKRL